MKGGKGEERRKKETRKNRGIIVTRGIIVIERGNRESHEYRETITRLSVLFTGFTL